MLQKGNHWASITFSLPPHHANSRAESGLAYESRRGRMPCSTKLRYKPRNGALQQQECDGHSLLRPFSSKIMVTTSVAGNLTGSVRYSGIFTKSPPGQKVSRGRNGPLRKKMTVNEPCHCRYSCERSHTNKTNKNPRRSVAGSSTGVDK